MLHGAIIMVGAAVLLTSAAGAQSAREVRGPAPVLPLTAGTQPPPQLLVDPPVESALAWGLVVIQYAAVNLHIVPTYGPAALDVSPRIGHIHVTVDDAAWHWADASGEPLIIQGLPAGPHSVRVDLVDANHKPFASEVIRFEIPAKQPGDAHH